MFAGMVMAAALFFTVGGIFMKLSEGLTKFWPTMIVFALFVIGAALQTLAVKREDIAVTYLWVVGLESILAFMFRRPAVQRELHAGPNCRPPIVRGIILLRSAYWLVRVPLRREVAGKVGDGCRISAVRNNPRFLQCFVDRRVDLLQLGEEFRRQPKITVASKRQCFILAAQFFVDRPEPDQLVLLGGRKALVAVALGDETLDRR
jgi:multidrug transporter EmrE-like cation transporter